MLKGVTNRHIQFLKNKLKEKIAAEGKGNVFFLYHLGKKYLLSILSVVTHSAVVADDSNQCAHSNL
jgi:hypothetical protein